MPRNGTGTYAVPTQFVPQSVIASATMNAQFADIATALTGSIAYDGQTSPIANLPMNGFRHNGVSAASGTTSVTGNLSGGRSEYASGATVQDNKLAWAGTSTGGANAYAITLVPAITAYADGAIYQFKSHEANTTATPTLAVNGLAPAILVKVNASGTIALGIGDIVPGQTVMVRYDGTLNEFVLLNPTSTAYGYIQVQWQVTSSPTPPTTATWTPALLNTLVQDTTGLVTLSSGSVVLPAGTYEAQGLIVGYNTGFAVRIQDVTDAITLCPVGSGGYGSVAANIIAVCNGKFTLSASKTIQLQGYFTSNAASATWGGSAVSGMTYEVAELILRKIA